MLGFHTCDISKYGYNAHQSGREKQAEIKKKENGTCRTAAVSAEFDVQTFIKNENQNTGEQIFQTDDPHSVCGGSK